MSLAQCWLLYIRETPTSDAPPYMIGPTIHRVLEQYNKAQVRLTVCDLAETPDGGDADSVIYTPTLVKRGPGPRTWIVGNLDSDEFLIELLELSGVDRRGR